MNWLVVGFCTVAAMVALALAPAFSAGLRALRRLSSSVRLAFCVLALAATLVAQKTNDPPRSVPSPRSAPVQSVAEWKAANWNTRGAWRDSFGLDFAEGWVFPWGTNHLAGVEVVSQGMLWPTPFDTNAVASLGVPVEIVPGLTTFGCELTPSNSYRFFWANAAVNRDTNNLVSGSLELFRNGDRLVSTNGVATFLPRELPFAHNGFGQDDEWVAANFTNAAEILSVGYPQWVDAQVGEGLLNGLYKLTVSIPDDPPETSFLFVGDYSVAVTNAGDYVFLLEKGLAYDLVVFPPDANVTFAAADDVPTMRGAPMARSFGDGGQWVPGSGNFWTDFEWRLGRGRFWWLPWLCGAPDVVHIDPDDGPVEFHADLLDYRGDAAAFHWTASEALSIASPNMQTTAVTAAYADWRRANLAVTAAFGPERSLTSYLDLSYGTNDAPQVHLSLNVPEGIACGGERQMMTATFNSDVETNGCVVLRCLSGSDKIEMWSAASNGVIVASSNSWAVTHSHSFTCYLYGKEQSELEGVEFEYKFIPEEGDVRTATAKSTVFECYAQAIDNTCVSGLSVVNPSFLDPQSNAVFRIQVRPETIPTSKIQWRVVSGSATFPTGSAGTEVNVLGSSGMVDLEVSVLGATDERMHFTSKVQ